MEGEEHVKRLRKEQEEYEISATIRKQDVKEGCASVGEDMKLFAEEATKEMENSETERNK